MRQMIGRRHGIMNSSGWTTQQIRMPRGGDILSRLLQLFGAEVFSKLDKQQRTTQ